MSSCLTRQVSAFQGAQVPVTTIIQKAPWGKSARRFATSRPLFVQEKDSDFPSKFEANDNKQQIVSRYKNINYGEEVEVKWRDPVR